MSYAMQSNQDCANPAGSTMDFLAYKIGKEEYGVDLRKVQELRDYEAVTRIADTPDFVKGVINLRGVIVPIIDLRVKFNLPTPVYNQFTVVIILNLDSRIVGVVVDSVSDVISLHADEIKPAPRMGGNIGADSLIGLGAVGERMLLLLDVDRFIPEIGSACAA